MESLLQFDGQFCKRKILRIFDRVFPEYENLFSNVFLTSSRKLLPHAVTAQEFADFDLCELTALLSPASRGSFGQEKAAAIQTVACLSIGIHFLVDSVRVQMRYLLEQLDLLEIQRQEVDSMLEHLMQQIPQYITSIPGIGCFATDTAILGEIRDINRFESPEKLVAYAGIDATVYQSGEFEALETHMGKRSSHISAMLFGRWPAWRRYMTINSRTISQVRELQGTIMEQLLELSFVNWSLASSLY